MFWHDKILRRYSNLKGFVTSVDLMTLDDIPIRFVIWDTMQHFQKVAAATKDKTAIATYYPPPTREDCEKCLGVISFCLDHIGAGIMTHELFHLGENLQRLEWESEHIADTLQILAMRFWDWYYQVFPDDERKSNAR